MGNAFRRVLALGILFLALAPGDSMAQAPGGVRRPRGIYAVVNIQENINAQQALNGPMTAAQLEAYFISLYQAMFNNPAISGIAIWERWCWLNPDSVSDANCTLNPGSPPGTIPTYDWSYLDDAFTQAAAWNSRNPGQPPKTIQLVPLPGFQTPAWVLNQIPSCDGLFASPVQTPPTNCGKATFNGFVEASPNNQLPLPWNPLYKSSWQTFLTTLAARYASNPAFVSIAVAGPTASSEEMILPGNANSANPQLQPDGSLIAPNAMWNALLAFHYPGQAAYQKTDQAFIDEWDNAIDMYGQIFSGVTLVVTTGSGLPNLSPTFTVPAADQVLFNGDCTSNPTNNPAIPTMDCAAETTILSYFMQPAVAGPNAKAVQEDGLEASGAGFLNLGVNGIRLVSRMTAQLPAPSGQVLGGAQFAKAFSNKQQTIQEGCTSKFPPDAADTPPGCTVSSTCTADDPDTCTIACIPQACLAPGVTRADLTSYIDFADLEFNDLAALIPKEQAEYNTLQWFFTATPAAASFGGTPGTAPLNYLQIYAADITYAAGHVNAPAQVVESGAPVSVTAQALLNLASQNVLQISEPAALLGIAISHSGNFTQGQQGDAYTVTVSNATGSGGTTSAVTVTDSLPAGLTLVSMAGAGWSCSTNICTRGDALPGGASYPPITVTVNVAVSAASSVTNQATVSGGGSASAAASDPTTIAPGAPPSAVTVFTPGQGATGVAITSSLTWQAPSGAASYNVYFGTSTPPPLLGTTAGTTYSPAMTPGVTYYWSVTAVNSFGSTPSAIWFFTSMPLTASGYGFVPLTPCRVADTRNANGAFGGPIMSAGSTRGFTIPSSACGVPSTAQAYSLNITVVPPGPMGYLTAWPAGQAQPNVSTLNSYNGAILANAAIVPAGSGGAISIYVSDATHVIIDINGYFAPPASSGALAFYPATPCRVADTRLASGPFGGPSLAAGATRNFTVPSSTCGIPSTAQAYSLNMTVVPPGPLTYLTTWPAGQTQPLVSTLNALQGQIAANAAIVPAGASGAISVFVSDASNVIVDINGYFAPPGNAGALYFYPVTPCRAADTRNGTGTFGGPSLGGGSVRNFPIPASSCGLPSTAQAYSLNMTVVPSGSLLYLSAWPAGQPQPVVSTLNDVQGQVVANAAIVPAGGGPSGPGGISVFVSDATNLIIDVNGYFGQ